MSEKQKLDSSTASGRKSINCCGPGTHSHSLYTLVVKRHEGCWFMKRVLGRAVFSRVGLSPMNLCLRKGCALLLLVFKGVSPVETVSMKVTAIHMFL